MIPTRIGQSADGMTFAAVMHYNTSIGLLLVSDCNSNKEFSIGKYSTNGKLNSNDPDSVTHCPSRDEMIAAYRGLGDTESRFVPPSGASIVNYNGADVYTNIPSILFPKTFTKTISYKFLWSSAQFKKFKKISVFAVSTQFDPAPNKKRLVFSRACLGCIPYRLVQEWRPVRSILIA